MSEEEKQSIKDSKDIIKELNKHKDKDFIGRLYYKNKPIEDILQILLNLIEKQQKEIEELRQRINRLIVMKYVENDYYTEVRKENSVSKYKIRKLIKEKAKTDTYNFKTIAVKDIEELLGGTNGKD